MERDLDDVDDRESLTRARGQASLAEIRQLQDQGRDPEEKLLERFTERVRAEETGATPSGPSRDCLIRLLSFFGFVEIIVMK